MTQTGLLKAPPDNLKPTDKLCDSLLRKLLDVTFASHGLVSDKHVWVDQTLHQIQWNAVKRKPGGNPQHSISFSKIRSIGEKESYFCIVLPTEYVHHIVETTDPIFILGLSQGYFSFKHLSRYLSQTTLAYTSPDHNM